MAEIDATRFGISNGAVTVASMILAMRVAGAPKRHILTALLALLITDPIGDAHSMYVADKGEVRKKTFMLSFGSQFAVQLFFVCTVLLLPARWWLPVSMPAAALMVWFTTHHWHQRVMAVAVIAVTTAVSVGVTHIEKQGI